MTMNCGRVLFRAIVSHFQNNDFRQNVNKSNLSHELGQLHAIFAVVTLKNRLYGKVFEINFCGCIAADGDECGDGGVLQ